jgi:two-component system, sensor histidine kinase
LALLPGMQELQLNTTQAHLIECEKVDLLIKGYKLATQSTLLAPLVIAWLFTNFIGLHYVVWPALWMYCMIFERFFFFRRYAKARDAVDFAPQLWATRVTLRLGLMGLTLALWTITAMATGNETAMFYAMTLAVITAAGALTQFCIYPRALWAFVTPYLLGIALQLVWMGSKSTLVSALSLVIFWAFLMAACTRFSAVMHREIAQRYQTQSLVQALSAQKELAEEASAAKTRFLAAASHDLRQPVHAVALLASALQAKMKEEHLVGESPKVLALLQAGVSQFADVVDEIMDIARLDAHAVSVNWQAVSLSALLSRVSSTYREPAQAKGLKLVIRMPENVTPVVHADAALLWRVLSNLVSNAVRYTDHGTVMVVVRPDSSLVNTLDASHQPRGWRIEVRDSGPGIAHGDQGRIYEEFFQLHNTQRSRKNGLGLGLAVAKRMAELMHLQIALRSKIGCGATFSVAALAVASDAPTCAALPEGAASHLHGVCALVVDDDEASRHALTQLLQTWGMQVQSAGSASEAASVCAAMVLDQCSPQILFTDHWIAQGESSQDVALAVMQAMPMLQAQRLQVAVMTGDVSPHVVQQVQDKGWYYASKPVRPQALRIWLLSQWVLEAKTQTS